MSTMFVLISIVWPLLFSTTPSWNQKSHTTYKWNTSETFKYTYIIYSFTMILPTKYNVTMIRSVRVILNIIYRTYIFIITRVWNVKFTIYIYIYVYIKYIQYDSTQCFFFMVKNTFSVEILYYLHVPIATWDILSNIYCLQTTMYTVNTMKPTWTRRTRFSVFFAFIYLNRPETLFELSGVD